MGRSRNGVNYTSGSLARGKARTKRASSDRHRPRPPVALFPPKVLIVSPKTKQDPQDVVEDQDRTAPLYSDDHPATPTLRRAQRAMMRDGRTEAEWLLDSDLDIARQLGKALERGERRPYIPKPQWWDTLESRRGKSQGNDDKQTAPESSELEKEVAPPSPEAREQALAIMIAKSWSLRLPPRRHDSTSVTPARAKIDSISERTVPNDQQQSEHMQQVVL